MLERIVLIPWWILVAGSLTLGLAPFRPMPHLFEKLVMLGAGELVRPIDMFDLLMHAAFPLLLLLKAITVIWRRRRGD